MPKNICKSIEYSPEIKKEISEQFEESGAKNLSKNLPDYSLELLNQANIHDIFSVKNLSFESIINIILNLIKNKIFAPIKFIIPIIFIIIIVLCLNIASKFVLCFIPVFGAFAISLGFPISGAAFNSSILFFNQIIMSMAKDMIIPVCSAMSSFCVISSLSTKIKLNKIFDIFYSIIKWLLIFFGALISFVFSVQKIIGNSIESLAGKELKFMSGLIPIVGSALSDATLIVRSSARILWVNIGSFGIIAIIFIFLPTVIDCLVWNISFQICEFLSQIFDFKNLENLFSSFRKIINIVLAIEIMFIFIFIFATSIAMKVNI